MDPTKHNSPVVTNDEELPHESIVALYIKINPGKHVSSITCSMPDLFRINGYSTNILFIY